MRHNGCCKDIEILLGEDGDADHEMTRRVFRKTGLGNTWFRVRDGQEMLDFINCEGSFINRDGAIPKLILLDCQLSKIDGVTLLERLQANIFTRHVPAVLLVASAHDATRFEKRGNGLHGCLVKPLTVEAFAALSLQNGLSWIRLNRQPSLSAIR